MKYRERHEDVRQEEDVLPTKLILVVLAGVLTFAFLLSVWGWLRTDAKNASIRPSGEYAEENLAKPHAVSSVIQDLFTQPGEGTALNLQKRRELEGWGWVDKDAGVVRMPIDEAMQLIIEENAQ